MICSNAFCRRTSPGDGPTCRWHVRNYGSEEEPIHVTLCNACKINFDQGKYCPFCVQIYREKDPDSFDQKEWVGCKNKGCRRWVHVECELEEGYDFKTATQPYQCPACRENAEMNERRRLGRHNAGDRLGRDSSNAATATSAMDRAAPVLPALGSDGDLAGASRSGGGAAAAPAAAAGEKREGRNGSRPSELKKSHSWSNGRPAPAHRYSSSDDGDGSPRVTSSPKASSTRPLRVDLSKLQTSSLRRYKRVYKLRDAPSTCKEGLKVAVAQHFASLVVSEEEIVRSFLDSFTRKQQQQQQQHQVQQHQPQELQQSAEESRPEPSDSRNSPSSPMEEDTRPVTSVVTASRSARKPHAGRAILQS